MQLKDFLLNQKVIYLKSINYNNSYEPSTNTPKLDCTDSVAVRREERSIFVEIKRSVSFSPECYFTIEISYEVELKIDPEKYSDFEEQSIDVEDAVKSDLNNLIPDEMDRISLLISQITDSFEGRPLVTVPKFNFSSNNK